MLEILKEICKLQPAYSSGNTPAMQRRGQLIREHLKNALAGYRDILSPEMGKFGRDFDVSASDGIGRKTEAPWVRFHSASMSPNPREGFYCVLHFSADGSAFWVTVGCGSTIWTGGDLKPVGDDELARRKQWVRETVIGELGSLEPLVDEISLGARAPLTRTFEKATAAAKRFDPLSTNQTEIDIALMAAARMLQAIYRRQAAGSDLTPSQKAEVEIEVLSRPQTAARGGQGFSMDYELRRAVELRAMELATGWLQQQGYKVEDKSLKAPFDLLASSPSQSLKVEVKGTTSREGRDIMMTKNEVALHRREKGSTALIVVSSIELDQSREPVGAIGGRVEAWIGWDIDEWSIEALSYKLTRDTA